MNNTAPSLLDHIWINDISYYNSAIVKSGITDHHTTLIRLPFQCKTNQNEKIKITFRDYSSENHSIFERKISEFNWVNIRSSNPETFMQNFISKLNIFYKESFPIKTKFVTHRYFKNPWHNKDVKKLSDARKKYHKILLLNFVSHEQYSAFRNKITNLIRKYKENFYHTFFI